MIQSGTKIRQYHEQAAWSSPLAIARIQEELRSVTSNGSIWEEQRYKRIEYPGNAFSLTLHPKREGVGFQRVNVTTEVSNSEIAAPDNVWVAPGK
jgi:hypothetical protein